MKRQLILFLVAGFVSGVFAETFTFDLIILSFTFFLGAKL
jgi:hypothetical protein